MIRGRAPHVDPAAPARVEGGAPAADRTTPPLRDEGLAVRVGGRVVLVVLMLLPVLVALGALTGRPWLPVDDFAITDLRVGDVWSWHTPLTGPWSRLGWKHPGPVMFWLRWPLWAVTGGATWSTRAGGAVVQGVALGWLAWVMWQRGARMLLAATTVTALSYLAIGPWLVRQPWDPNVVVPWFILFLFLTWLTATGSFRQLSAMTAAGSVIVQTQVGYVPLVAACFVWVVVVVVGDARRGAVPERWGRVLAISAGVGLVLWSFPLLDVVVHRPGNLWTLLMYFSDGGHPAIGFADAVGHMAAEFRWLPPWLGGPLHVNPAGYTALPSTGWLLLVPLAAVVVALLVARDDRSRHDRRWVALAAVVLVVGVLSISNADEPRPYTFQWRSVVAVFLLAACAWTIAAAFAPRVPRVARTITIVGMTVLVAWAAIAASVAVATDPSHTGLESTEPALADLMVQLGPQLPSSDQVVLLDPEGSVHGIFAGLVDALDRRGVDVRVRPEQDRVYGPHRSVGKDHVDTTWYVKARGSGGPDRLAEPGAKVLARSWLGPTENAELTRLQTRLAAQLRAAGRTDLLPALDSPLVVFAIGAVPGVDVRAAGRAGVLNAAAPRGDRCRCAVIAVPA